MCGRYYVDVDTAREIEKLVWECDVSGMNWDEMEELCREEGLSEIFSHVRDYG